MTKGGRQEFFLKGGIFLDCLLRWQVSPSPMRPRGHSNPAAGRRHCLTIRAAAPNASKAMSLSARKSERPRRLLQFLVHGPAASVQRPRSKPLLLGQGHARITFTCCRGRTGPRCRSPPWRRFGDAADVSATPLLCQFGQSITLFSCMENV